MIDDLDRSEPLEGQAPALDAVVFRLAADAFALPLSHVREMLRPPRITPVPRTGREILGIIALRGRALTVFDLRLILQRREAPVGPASRVLVVDDGDEVVGFLVDRVDRVIALRADEIEPSPVLGGGYNHRIQGICRPRDARARSTRPGSEPPPDAPHDLVVLLDPMQLRTPA